MFINPKKSHKALDYKLPMIMELLLISALDYKLPIIMGLLVSALGPSTLNIVTMLKKFETTSSDQM